MRFSFVVPWALLLTASCSSADLEGGSGGAASPAAVDSLSFDEDGTLELKPSETHEVAVTTTPGATVKFLLLGDSSDAGLDASTVQADGDGHAVVTLQAPTKPSTFHLAATAGEHASDELSVAVSEFGFGTLQVDPIYTGTRTVTHWTASVVVGASCSDVISAFPKDPVGGLVAEAQPDRMPVIESVPVGPPLAVAVRSSALMWGCTEMSLATPKTTVDVQVQVINRPMVLDQASLVVRLEFGADHETYPSLLSSTGNDLLDAAFPTGTPASDLLDTIAESLPSNELDAFNEHRSSANLDEVLAQYFAADPQVLASGWLGNVQAATDMGSPQITGVLKGDPSHPDMAKFDATALGPVSSVVAGVPDSVPLPWSATADDTLLVGGSIPFSGTRYVGALLAAEAMADNPSATDASDALALGIDCETAGAYIEGFATCSAGCGAMLCRDALTAMWQRGLAAGDDLGEVSVSISTAAQVDEQAEPVSVQGTWLGALDAAGVTCQVKGDVSGSSGVPPP